MTTKSTNYWPDARCAKAFWNQHELPPYQELLRDTADWLEPTVGQRWLDLGCGSGQLSRLLWQKSRGQVEAIVDVVMRFPYRVIPWRATLAFRPRTAGPMSLTLSSTSAATLSQGVLKLITMPSMSNAALTNSGDGSHQSDAASEHEQRS